MERWCDEIEPVEYESEYISEKDDDENTSEEPEILVSCSFLSEKRVGIIVESFCNIDTDRSYTREWVGSNRCIEEGKRQEQYPHEYPCREYCRRYREIADHPTINMISLCTEDMRTDMFGRFGCMWKCFWSHNFRRREYIKSLSKCKRITYISLSCFALHLLCCSISNTLFVIPVRNYDTSHGESLSGRESQKSRVDHMIP